MADQPIIYRRTVPSVNSTHTLHSAFSYVLLHSLLHTFQQVVFLFLKDENQNLGYFDFELVQKQHCWQWTIFIKIYGRAFVWLSQSGPDYNQIPIIWIKLSLSLPLKYLEPEFHNHKKQSFNRGASIAFQKCAENPILQKGASPKKIFPRLGRPLSKLPSAGGKEPKYET